MLTFPATVRIWLATEPVDMRPSFRGLSGVVREHLADDPLSGHVYCFINRRRAMLKLMVYDRAGFWIYYRRLSRGRFQLPATVPGQRKVQLDATMLGLILDGIDLNSVKRRVRYRHPVAEVAGS